VLEDAALPKIVEFLGERLDAEVYIDTQFGEPLIQAPAENVASPSERNLDLAEIPADLVRATMESGRAARMTPTDKRATFLVPVPSAGAREQVRMWVRHRSTAGFDGDAVRAMEGCALLIALQRSREAVQAHAEARLVRELLADLLSPAAMMHSTAVMARATALGHDPSHAHVPIVGTCVTSSPAGVDEQVSSRLTSTLSTSLRGVRPKPVVGTVGAAVVVLLPADSRRKAIKTFSELVRRSSWPDYRWIVGTEAPGLAESQDHLNTALRAANMLTQDSPTVLYLESLGVPALLLDAGASDRLLALADSTLGPVLRAEKERPGGLLATLVEWFRNGMSTGRTAQRLHVHTNTVGYRLRRIGDLTGLQLTDPGDLMTIRLALDILQIRGLANGDLASLPITSRSEG
jgi:sugar diacid utilization regulator